MPFIPADETIKLAITFTDTSGNEAVNVIHAQTNETAVTVPIINDAIDAVETWLNAWWDTVANNQWRAIRIEGRDLTSENSFYVSRTVDVQGLGVADALPPQATIAISLRSNLAGRSRRGRLYHVGTDSAVQDGGYINPTAIETYITAYEALMTALAGVNLTWVVVSYVSNGVPRSNALRTAVQYIVITDNIIDSMNKRKPKP